MSYCLSVNMYGNVAIFAIFIYSICTFDLQSHDEKKVNEFSYIFLTTKNSCLCEKNMFKWDSLLASLMIYFDMRNKSMMNSICKF